ncbi:MAG: fumarylacetoacetate hydrolase family protein, partial [Armatimonadetes bacterium]|nr:fumarylacetoacetate hydrolase family protein [Armatimonadota bacterium]
MDKFVVPADARSWVEYSPQNHFPIQNLPFGVARPKGRDECLVVAIGGYALDLQSVMQKGLISEEDFPVLDSFINLDGDSIRELRKVVFHLLEKENGELRDSKRLREHAMIPLDKANLQVPIPPPAFVDFYSGIHHARNVGSMFRPDQEPLLPNYRHLPVGYNGRASSVVASGRGITRPKGITQPPGADAPGFGPCKGLDFELEMGFYVSLGNDIGKRIIVSKADDH